MDGSKSPPVVVRFLKVLVPGFETAVKLPPLFSRMMDDTDLNSKRALLKTSKGSWEIDIKKCDHGCLHFLGKTWEGYVSEHNLKEGDFIVFEHYGDLHFNTNMFDETGCEKDFATSEEDDEEEESSSEDDVEHRDGRENTPHEDSKSQFQLTLARCNFNHHYMTIPAEFGRSNGMRQDGTMELRNAIGESWLAKLNTFKKTKGSKSCFFRIVGVSAFYKENQLKEEDVCIFKLNHSSSNQNHFVMDVKFMRN